MPAFPPDDPYAAPPWPPPAWPPAPSDPGPTVPLAPGAMGGIPGLDFSGLPATPDLYVSPLPHGAPAHGALPGATVRVGAEAWPRGDAGAGKTVGMAGPQAGMGPVVGWLVCTDGPQAGRDFRLHAGRNFIGRSPEMHVALTDPYVSRARQAVIVYDPRANVFTVSPGEATGLVYLGGVALHAPALLHGGDVIELGHSRLVFAPFCTAAFQWESLRQSAP